jgi:formylglycine-generating enzyme required for sulfatase activity
MNPGPDPEIDGRWRRLTAALGRRQWDGEQIADLLWMARLLAPSTLPAESDDTTNKPPPKQAPLPPRSTPSLPGTSSDAVNEHSEAARPKPPDDDQPRADLEPATGTGSMPADAPAVGVRDPGLLPRPRRIGRALAPLSVWVCDGPAHHLDVPATVEEIARARAEGRRWQPVLTARREPWLSLDLVFDNGPSMALWRQLRRELPRRLGRAVRWRDLRCWLISRDRDGGVGLRGLQGSGYSPKLLRRVAPRGLVLVVSDAVDPLWFDGTVATLLRQWAAHQPVALLQVLPRRLWPRTALAQQTAGWVSASRPLQPNGELHWIPFDAIAEEPAEPADPPAVERESARPFTLPLATLEPEDLAAMAKLLLGARGNSLLACQIAPQSAAPAAMAEVAAPSLEERLAVFLFSASPGARRLLALLTFAPLITLPVVRLVQEQVASGGPPQLAEVVFSGLLVNAVAPGGETIPIDRQRLCFAEETLRPRLREGLRVGEARDVFDLVERHVAASLGRSVEEFEALLRDPRLDDTDPHHALLAAFASVAPSCLRGLGSRYEALASAIETAWQRKKNAEIPELETIPFEAGHIALVELSPIQFITTPPRTGAPQDDRRTIAGKTWAFWEPLQRHGLPFGATADAPGPVTLTLVEIPAGKFLMGSPENDLDRFVTEGPQHQVTLDRFFMAQTPITQAQWRTVAQWEEQAGERWGRKLDPNPSWFSCQDNQTIKQGGLFGNFRLGREEPTEDQRPVERVSWHDAKEFCQRITQRTGRLYTLPSEAQWEFACRAGTTTPFAFGGTLTEQLANYHASNTYANGPKGEWRRQTNPVNNFPANARGLQDMHGNVWEWCLDHWHENYEGAPEDGGAWLYNEEKKNEPPRPLRGGSWLSNPGNCRSACRKHFGPGSVYSDVGFRVVCLPQGRSTQHLTPLSP